MAKTVRSVKNSLKFKAQAKPGILSVRVGVKKYAVPIEARILSTGEFMFLSFPASSEVYKISGKQLAPLGAESDASEAYQALNPGKRKGRRRRAQVSLPTNLTEALKAIPAGYRLGYGADGEVKLIKTRKRSPKGK